MKTISTIFAAALALVLQGAFAGAYASTTSTGGHCTGMTVTDYVASRGVSDTTSTAWQNVTDAQLNFTTSAAGCVIVTFSGVAYVGAGPNDFITMYVRTLFDGNNTCAPGGYDDRFSGAAAPVPLAASSITRICKNVPAGAHTLQVQYHGSDGVNHAYIFSSVLTLTHN